MYQNMYSWESIYRKPATFFNLFFEGIYDWPKKGRKLICNYMFSAALKAFSDATSNNEKKGKWNIYQFSSTLKESKVEIWWLNQTI